MSDLALGLIDNTNKVVYIRSDLVKRYPQVTERISKISKDCGTKLNLCSPYPEGCLSYLVMAFSSIVTTDIDQLLKKYADKIVGYLVAVVFDDMNEIYDVCVAKDQRGLGSGKNLIKSIITRSIRPKIWLGIDVKNGMWNAVLKLYVRNGFLEPTPGQTTPHGKTTDITFVGLTWSGNNNPSQDQIDSTIQKANKYKKLALERACSNRFVMSRSLLVKIKDAFIDKEREFAGIFRILCYDEQQRAILGLETSSIIEGDQETSTVSAPEGNYYSSYHTHPNVCYAKFGCYIGWPSSRDMSNVFGQYVHHGIIINMVFSREGVYIVSLTPAFQVIAQLLRDSPECIEHVYDAIKDRFRLSKTFGELIRKEAIATEKDLARKLQKYHSDVSSYSLSMLVKEISEMNKYGFEGAQKLTGCLADAKFKGNPIIFSAKFFDWGYISNRESLEFSISYAEDKKKLAGECPLKVDGSTHKTCKLLDIPVGKDFWV